MRMVKFLVEARSSYRDVRLPVPAISGAELFLILMTTHRLHGWSTRAALDANVTSSLHEVRSANIPRLILLVFVQKKAPEVLHRVVDLARDFLIRE